MFKIMFLTDKKLLIINMPRQSCLSTLYISDLYVHVITDISKLKVVFDGNS